MGKLCYRGCAQDWFGLCRPAVIPHGQFQCGRLFGGKTLTPWKAGWAVLLLALGPRNVPYPTEFARVGVGSVAVLT